MSPPSSFHFHLVQPTQRQKQPRSHAGLPTPPAIQSSGASHPHGLRGTHELTIQAVASQKQLSIVKTQIQSKEKERKILTLTMRELAGVPQETAGEETRMYKAVGKMCVVSLPDFGSVAVDPGGGAGLASRYSKWDQLWYVEVYGRGLWEGLYGE